ncbi:MAG: aldose 1-epimerase family protein [Rikenellaceae bacterium]
MQSDQVILQVSKKGAEMMSIVNKESGREFLWQGDPTHWKFRSPILFPIVGGVNGGTYRLDGKEYSMTNHGFARDYDWDLVKLTSSDVVFRLKAPEEKRANYPFDFVLEIAYSVGRDVIKVAYKVVNPSDETIYFQLGAHPGFNYKDFDADASIQGYYQFDDKAKGDKLSVSVSNKDGLIVKKRGSVTLAEEGVMPITKSTFNNDALILEGSQTQSIALLDRNKEPYVRVKFDAPVVGMWSKGGNMYAPFACIEPWYGRCDDANYSGDYKEKPWVQSLEAKGVFKTNMSIWIGR